MSEAYSQIVGACASDIPEVLLSCGSSSIVFGGGWGPQSMSGCRLNGGSQAVNDLFGSGETTQAATSRRLRLVPPRLDPTFRSVAGERGPLSGPHNCDVAPRQLNEIAVSDRAAVAGLTQFSATHRDVHCKPLNENVMEQSVRSSLTCAIISVRPLVSC